VASQLRPILLGRDPRASEQLWDMMFRLHVHGRQGEPMHAISAVDLALWDLKGKWLGKPLWQILGGATRERIPIYCSTLGFEVLDMGLVRERALMFKEKGIRAQKWFFRFGPTSGREGLHRNVELVRTLRETLGCDYEIMLDCWQSFDYRYTVELAAAIEQYRPYWIEDSIMPDRVDAYRKLRDKIRIPVAGAEHEYTRWGMLRFLEKQALDIYQPDPIWCGGLSETLKIATLTTVHDVICIPHGGSTYASAVFSALQSPIMTPYQEFLWKSNECNQAWYREKLWPENGTLPLPTWPGIYPALDEDRIEGREEL
jgi:L-alanine-DL-glutamate epimerase-like enolase superfamily enzyme